MSRTIFRRCAAGLSCAALLSLLPATGATADAGLGYDPATTKGGLQHISSVVSAKESWAAGYTGKGIGVALIDTGVTEVPGLDSGNVWHGPDLSFDSQDPELRTKDAYGHGTHLASIIAGRDAVLTPKAYGSGTSFNGIAPDATLYSVKVGAQDGAVDVSQVIAAINWVVEHRNEGPVPIRVINLSYGTDSVQDTKIDPLVYAVENAWKAGITVVVAGGNDGSTLYTLANPARSPYVLSVGASDSKGTVPSVDDTVPLWASRGTNARHVDVVAPGVSVLGLRVPGGYADELHPDARVGTRFAKASGTSQAAAVVSGQVALLLQQNPRLTPDQVKRQVMVTASAFASTSNQYRGNGVAKVRAAQLKDVTATKQAATFYSTGTGSLEASRGTSHVTDGVSELRGEMDVFGKDWEAQSYSRLVASGDIWQASKWRGTTLTGSGWEGRSWRGGDWTSTTWSGRSWRDEAWAGRSWRDGTWSGRSWRDATWSGRSWRTADLASEGWR